MSSVCPCTVINGMILTASYTTHPSVTQVRMWRQIYVNVKRILFWTQQTSHVSSTSYLTAGSQQSPKYVYVSQPMNWSGAQSYCRKKYIDLATVKNLEENSMISTTMASPYKWIGLFRDPDFYWSDGRNFTFSKWEGANNPLNSDRVVCGIISPQRSGKWKFRPCETKLPFVCYIDPSELFLEKNKTKTEIIYLFST